MEDHLTFGRFGGAFVPETLSPALAELRLALKQAQKDKTFWAEFEDLLKHYVGRPTPLYETRRFSARAGCRVILKDEDLNHTGAHKINNAIGQCLLAKRMGKKRIIAETGAGQHGVATATACALLDLPCAVFMGEEDIRRQAPNVERMKLLGAEVVCVTSGSRTLKDACNEALRNWVSTVDHTHYVIGSVVGPDPFPRMVRDFQSVIGHEARRQMKQQFGALPHSVVACVGGGSNAMGIFHAFVKDKPVALVGVEAAGEGLNKRHAAPLSKGSVGILHGSVSYVLQDEDGQVQEAHSISAGLDYPGVGPEHAYFKETGRVKYVAVTDDEALSAFESLTLLEGIIPALESSHALAWVLKQKGKFSKDALVLVSLSGRGDKDMQTVMGALEAREKTRKPKPKSA